MSRFSTSVFRAEIPCCSPAVGTPKPPAIYDGRSITRLAVMGGSYGNVPALTACIRHAEQAGCDGFAFLGDATGFCGHSDEIVELIRRRFDILVAGNYEQKAAAREEDCGCNYTNDEDNLSGGIAHRWAMQSLGDTNRAWLGTWPDLVLLETARGTLVLSHGSPAQTNEFLYESQLDAARLVRWLDTYGARGLVCTHSGFPWMIPLPDDRFAANCGVCGKPDHDGDPAVHYATLELTVPGTPVATIHRVSYPHDTWADELAAEGVDEMFTRALRNGVWTCGLGSLPAVERTRGARVKGLDTFQENSTPV